MVFVREGDNLRLDIAASELALTGRSIKIYFEREEKVLSNQDVILAAEFVTNEPLAQTFLDIFSNSPCLRKLWIMLRPLTNEHAPGIYFECCCGLGFYLGTHFNLSHWRDYVCNHYSNFRDARNGQWPSVGQRVRTTILVWQHDILILDIGRIRTKPVDQSGS